MIRIQRIEEKGRCSRTCQRSRDLRSDMSGLTDPRHDDLAFARMNRLHGTHEIVAQARDECLNRLRLALQTILGFINNLGF